MIEEKKLVQWAEDIIRSAKEKLKEKGETGHSQASKAIEVAQASDSLLVFNNWLRYQLAREEASGEFWSIETQGKKTIAQCISERVMEIKDMKSVVRFLGYFRRALVGIKYLDQIPIFSEEGERR